MSRSATLACGYIMQSLRISAHKALEYVKARRSVVAPNNGFWRALCAFEGQLGIVDRWGRGWGS